MVEFFEARRKQITSFILKWLLKQFNLSIKQLIIIPLEPDRIYWNFDKPCMVSILGDILEYLYLILKRVLELKSPCLAKQTWLNPSTSQKKEMFYTCFYFHKSNLCMPLAFVNQSMVGGIFWRHNDLDINVMVIL